MIGKNILLSLICLWILFITNGTPLFAEKILAEEKPEVFVQLGHTNLVFSVAFSPDGKYALSGSDDKTIKLWDISTGKEIRTFKGHTSTVRSVAFSPDGKYFLSGSWDKTIKLWDVSTGREIRTFIGHTEAVNSVAFSPDGRYVLSGGGDGILKLWDVSTGKEIRTFKGHMDIVTSVAFFPNGKYILSGSNDGTLRIWSVSTGKEIAQFISFTDGEWIVITPEGYYNSSPYGEYYLNVRVGNNVYDIKNFRETFYRPDLVRKILSEVISRK